MNLPPRKKLFFLSLTGGTIAVILFYAFLALLKHKELSKLRKQLQTLKEREMDTELLTEATKQLSFLWKKGDIDLFWSNHQKECLDLLGPYNQEQLYYTRCNPSYLQCRFQRDSFKSFSHKHQTFHFKVKDITFISPKLHRTEETRSSGIKVSLFIKEKPQLIREVFLENLCHEVYLPQRIYSFGPQEFKRTSSGAIQFVFDDDKMWDNFGQDIFIDQFLVTNRDIREWILHDPKHPSLKKKEIFFNKEKLSSPAISLTPTEMREYCSFHGKQLLLSHYFDAASFIPDDLKNPFQPRQIKSPYPWARNLKTKLPTYTHEEKNKIKFCKKMFTQECFQEYSYLNFNQDYSWIGMSNILGGPLQYLPHPTQSSLTIKTSSYYFSRFSPWHGIGERTSWNEENFFAKSFDWHNSNKEFLPPLSSDNEELHLGFRCFRFERVL